MRPSGSSSLLGARRLASAVDEEEEEVKRALLQAVGDLIESHGLGRSARPEPRPMSGAPSPLALSARGRIGTAPLRHAHERGPRRDVPPLGAGGSTRETVTSMAPLRVGDAGTVQCVRGAVGERHRRLQQHDTFMKLYTVIGQEGSALGRREAARRHRELEKRKGTYADRQVVGRPCGLIGYAPVAVPQEAEARFDFRNAPKWRAAAPSSAELEGLGVARGATPGMGGARLAPPAPAVADILEQHAYFASRRHGTGPSEPVVSSRSAAPSGSDDQEAAEAVGPGRSPPSSGRRLANDDEEADVQLRHIDSSPAAAPAAYDHLLRGIAGRHPPRAVGRLPCPQEQELAPSTRGGSGTPPVGAIAGPNLQYQHAETHGGAAVDVDSMSYEELLSLQERMGTVERGVTECRLNSFLVVVPAEASAPAAARPSTVEDRTCGVCLEGFIAGMHVLQLPCCRQWLHCRCGGRWFSSRFRCPLCTADVRS